MKEQQKKSFKDHFIESGKPTGLGYFTLVATLVAMVAGISTIYRNFKKPEPPNLDKAEYLYILGEQYEQFGEYEKALYNFLESASKHEELDSPFSVRRIESLMAAIKLCTKLVLLDIEQYHGYIEEAIDTSTKIVSSYRGITNPKDKKAAEKELGFTIEDMYGEYYLLAIAYGSALFKTYNDSDSALKYYLKAYSTRELGATVAGKPIKEFLSDSLVVHGASKDEILLRFDVDFLLRGFYDCLSTEQPYEQWLATQLKK